MQFLSRQINRRRAGWREREALAWLLEEGEEECLRRRREGARHLEDRREDHQRRRRKEARLLEDGEEERLRRRRDEARLEEEQAEARELLGRLLHRTYSPPPYAQLTL
jgi:hypothetical protein